MEEGPLERSCDANSKEEQITETVTKAELQENTSAEKEDSTNKRMTEEGEKVVSESTTNESSLDDGWEGPRERKVGKTNGDKEDSFSPEKKTSEGVQLLTYFEAPPHLRFNQYVLGSYRPPMDVHGCLARLVKCYFCEY